MSEIGRHKRELDTPALLVDVAVLDRNIARMVAMLRGTECGLRPHFKAHRTPAIMRRQLAAGGRSDAAGYPRDSAGGGRPTPLPGVTCAKLAEAEHLADLGFDGFLVANEVVGERKWARLARLAARAEVIVGVDHPETARGIARHAREVGATVGVLIDVEIGLERCGVAPGLPALSLARQVAEEQGLALRGVMGYEGHVIGLPEEEKERACRAAIGQLVETAARLRDDGLLVEIVSAGGTGSFTITSRIPGVTELQCGTYAVMDLLFREVGGAPFDYATTLLATVVSRPVPERAIVDAGKKALHASFGWARPVGLPGAALTALHSEHGILALEGEARDLPLGATVEFIPYYVEGTINLHDRIYAIQDDHVIDVWEVSGRDCSR
jgi:D-serine deaminase-like pyridoxal phosphate-dependent protein